MCNRHGREAGERCQGDGTNTVDDDTTDKSVIITDIE